MVGFCSAKGVVPQEGEWPLLIEVKDSGMIRTFWLLIKTILLLQIAHLVGKKEAFCCEKNYFNTIIIPDYWKFDGM